MEETIYKPNIYEGEDPYIFVSFHKQDRERVCGILKRIDMRGFRFWINDGIAPGMEPDEVIAEHIEKCTLFIAFLSGSYLGFLDTVDELNYSRDVNKDYLLVYLEDVPLPAGLDMRFMRAQSIRAFAADDETVFSQLLNIDDVSRFYGITDARLRSTAENVFSKLEKLYPDHKVFALNAINKNLSESVSALYTKAGYPSAEQLLRDYGFSQISTEDARSLRSSVLYQPGYEPELIRQRVDYIMETLSADYPGKVITDLLSKSHKSIYSSLLGISVWLGYDSAADMLNAYGFSGVSSSSGRTEIDHRYVLDQLMKRYDGKEKPTKLSTLAEENPDLKGNLKTMSNRSVELFGMTMNQYLKSIGLIASAEKKEKTSRTALYRAEAVAAVKALYEKAESGQETLEDVEKILNQITVIRNRKGLVSLTDCSSCSEEMQIPLGIDCIAGEAFIGQSDLVKLTLSPTVKVIQDSAFADCTGLEVLVLPEGLEQVGNYAFSGCTSLKRVVFPKSLKAVGNEAFAGCEELAEVEFGNPRTNVQEDAFDGCIFDLCSLQDADSSPAENFELAVDRKNQAKITAYTGCEEVVVIPGMIAGHPVVSIEKGCFKGNRTVREIYINDQITSLGNDAFKECVSLEKIHISESVSSLSGSVFSGCTNLAEANIPDCVSEVQRGLFKDSPLTTLYIGKGVRRISPDAFYKGNADLASGLYLKQKSLENLIVDTKNECFSAEGTTLLSKDRTVLLAELGDPVQTVVPQGVVEIGSAAYDRISSLSEIVFPTGLKKIGEKAFAGTKLKSVELPASVEIIEPQAFSFCRDLTALELNEGLRIIGQQAFEGCPIEDVYIPATVETLGANSFLAISTYPGQISQRFRVDTASRFIVADDIALYQRSEDALVLVKAYFSGLRLKPNESAPEPLEYDIMEGTTDILPHAFAMCNNLRAVHIPDSVRSIGDLAFWGCSKLTEVHIPENCTDLSPKAFFGISISFV